MPFKSDKQRKWMYANEPDMAKKWEKEEVIRGKLRNLIKQEIKSINEGWWEDLSDKAQAAYIKKHGAAPNSSTPEPIGKYKKGEITKKIQSDKGREIARKMAGNMTGAVKKIEKIKKGLSDDPKVKAALRKANESVNEDNIKFSKEEMAQLHKDGKVEKGGHTIEFGESVNESDLGLTYKKGKTVKVTHKKSGKELVIIDKPNVKREYEKIGYFAEGKINEGFDKYYLSSLLDSNLKKKLEIAIKKLKGKVDGVGTDYIWFRMPSANLDLLTALITKLDRNKNVWIGDKRKNNIWDRRQKINKLEATTSVSVPGYLSPKAFSKSTQNAIDIDDEDDEKKESMAAPFRRRKSRGLGRPMKVGLNELQMAPFSSQEARSHINSDIKDMSKHLGKASQRVIKIMMDGVKDGKYTAMDISRGIKEGPAARTHFGEMTFIQSLWTKMREKFRRYSKDRKLS